MDNICYDNQLILPLVQLFSADQIPNGKTKQCTSALYTPSNVEIIRCAILW